MHRGYVKLWRKTVDSEMFQNHKLWAVWTWLLLNATHKEMEVYAGLEKVKLYPGQIITGRKLLSRKLLMSERNIRTCLYSLQTTGNLTIKSTNKYSIITIINWDIYQNEDEKSTSNPTSNRPASDQQVTTKQEHKNIRNIYTSDFLTFWDCYPKKVGKGGANRAWEKAKGKPPIADLVAAVERQSKSDQWKRDNGQYIPNPQTWLNQRRWEDGETDKPAPRYISPYMKKYLESLKNEI